MSVRIQVSQLIKGIDYPVREITYLSGNKIKVTLLEMNFVIENSIHHHIPINTGRLKLRYLGMKSTYGKPHPVLKFH